MRDTCEGYSLRGGSMRALCMESASGTAKVLARSHSASVWFIPRQLAAVRGRTRRS